MRPSLLSALLLRRSFVFGVACLAAAGCSRSRTPADSVLADDLQHDLELASTTGIELAGVHKGAVEVTSSVEQGPKAMPVRARRAPRPHAKGHRRAVPSPKAEEPAPTTVPEETAAATIVAAAGESPENPAPAIEPQEPAPAPVAVPDGQEGGAAEGRHGGGWGRAIGTVVGVVIRGGAVGVDKCDEHERGRRPGGIASLPVPIPGGVNLPYPVTGSTFPRTRF